MALWELASPIRPLNAGLFVSPGFGTHATRKIDSYELIFVTQGHLDMFEEDEIVHVERNQTLVLDPGKRHGGLLPYTPDVNFYWIHFGVTSLAAPNLSIDICKVADVNDPELLTELFCRFISDQESGTLHPVAASHLVTLMLCLICGADDMTRNEAPVAVDAGNRGKLVDRIHSHIAECYREPLSTSQIARRLGYSADYLERVFRKEVGMSILDAVHSKRIAEARALLRTEGRKNISEIAFACGYSDPGYFRRMFKRLTGLTPKQFRVLYCRTHINTH